VFPNIISRDGVRHDVMPPVNITWSVEKPVPSGGKNLRIVIQADEWSKPVHDQKQVVTQIDQMLKIFCYQVIKIKQLNLSPASLCF
jgi:hypothetical protein